MAEVVGIIGSVIAIVNLAKPTIKIVETLYKIAKDDNTLEDEILSVAERIEAANDTIELATSRIKDSRDKIKAMKHPTSRVAKYIQKGRLNDSIRKLTNDVERQLTKTDKRLEESGSSNFRLLNGMKWYFWVSTEMTVVFNKLDRIAMYLSIIGPILELEIMTYLYEKTQAETEIASVLEIHIHSLHDQLKDAERIVQRMSRGRKLKESYKDFGTESQDYGKLLVGLSKSMRQTGNVPIDIRPQKSGQRRRRHKNSSALSATSLDSRLFWTWESSQISHTSRSSPNRTPPILHVSRVTHTRRLPHTASIASVTPPRQTDPIPQSPRIPEPSQTLADTQLMGGWTKDPRELNEASPISSATVSPHISGNYISVAKAHQLSLNIRALEQHDAHRLSQSSQNENGIGRVIGKVFGIEWRQKRHSTPIVVDFWVTERYSDTTVEDPIFGSEFAQKLKRIAEI
ncbi:hypothetical protein FLONG3_618 [Fusarium longipes]|uniref:Fungal N-terminal domain-containing protein n=1 Tax=Fusarium longipes TaxID=694270 RepID=A0A395T9U1_9HYPO|nr:hypothetical protein FLONG3_618 [Fusarium longipes]